MSGDQKPGETAKPSQEMAPGSMPLLWKQNNSGSATTLKYCGIKDDANAAKCVYKSTTKRTFVIAPFP